MNEKFLELLKANRYDELSDVKISIKHDSSTDKLVRYLLSLEDVLFDLHDSSFRFDEVTLDKIRKYAVKYVSNSDDYCFSNFDCLFLDNKDDLGRFILNNRDLFIYYFSKDSYILNSIVETQEGLNIILSLGRIDLLPTLDNMDTLNMKLFVKVIKDRKLPSKTYYLFDKYFMRNVFSKREFLSKDEFYQLLCLFSYRCSYIAKTNNCDTSHLIKDNLAYLVSVVSNRVLPECLSLSKEFRDYCIEINRYDLAIQCLLPFDILKDAKVCNGYANELGLSIDVFEERISDVLDYYNFKNLDVSKSFIANMLRDPIYEFPLVHYEKFINDHGFSLKFCGLSNKELEVILFVLKRFDYVNFDTSFMIDCVVSNIGKYKELVDSIDLDNFKNLDVNNFVRLLQDDSNFLNIKNVEDLRNIKELKKRKYLEDKGDLDLCKRDLLSLLFNVTIDEAKRIDDIFCKYRGKVILDDLSKSELSKDLLFLLQLLHGVLEEEDVSLLDYYYNNYLDSFSYDIPIPLESFLRSQYTFMYDKELFKDSKKTDIVKNVKYKDNDVKMIIPRGDFKFLIHCLGTCETFSSNSYREDWLERPNIMDHYVACSYVDEVHFLNIRSNSEVIYGFGNLEGGSLIGSGTCDIDSIGFYSLKYDSTRELMNQGGRAQFLPPSVMLKYTTGYNEIVVDRRNNAGDVSSNYKRKPDYIIYPVSSIGSKNELISASSFLDHYFPFFNEEEKKLAITYSLQRQSLARGSVTKLLSRVIARLGDSSKYHDLISSIEANYEDYVNAFLRASLYSESLKAASEFDVPIIIVDKAYYFARILHNSSYSDSEKEELYNMFMGNKRLSKHDLVECILENVSYEKIVEKFNRKQYEFQIMC